MEVLIQNDCNLNKTTDNFVEGTFLSWGGYLQSQYSLIAHWIRLITQLSLLQYIISVQKRLDWEEEKEMSKNNNRMHPSQTVENTTDNEENDVDN